MRLLEPGLSPETRFHTVPYGELETALSEQHNQRLAVRVGGDADARVLTDAVDRLGLITINFGAFRDGRGFSLASILRAKGYKGELVASGDLLPDQAIPLARTGFDAVELQPGASLDEWTKALAAFSAVYQPAADRLSTVWAQRRARATGKPQAVEEAPAANEVSHGEVVDLDARVAALNARYRDASPREIIQAVVEQEFPGRVAMLSSFGAEAAVGLHLLSQVDPTTPVLFLDTDRHFAPTLQYRDRLTAQLGLTNLRVLTPKDAETHDPKGDLWRTDPDACCAFRKVQPLNAVTGDYDVLITGRKRFHGGARVRLPVFEHLNGQIRVNPLANWDAEQIKGHFEAYALPEHPLTQGGYRSIGCWPCTQPSSDEEDVRAGRWSGVDKTECGIHMPSRWVADAERRAS